MTSKQRLIPALVVGLLLVDRVASASPVTYKITVTLDQQASQGSRASPTTLANDPTNPSGVSGTHTIATTGSAQQYRLNFYLSATGFDPQGSGDSRGFGLMDFSALTNGVGVGTSTTYVNGLRLNRAPSSTVGWIRSDPLVSNGSGTEQYLQISDDTATDLVQLDLGIENTANFTVLNSNPHSTYLDTHQPLLIGRAWIDWDGATTTTLGTLINNALHATWSGHVSQGQTNLYGVDNPTGFQTDSISFLGVSTWTGGAGAGGGGLWSNGSNWNAAPINGVALAFAGNATSPAPTNDSFLTNVNFITFNSGAGQFNVGGTGGGQTISIAGGITNNSSNLQTVGLALTLTAPQQFNAASGPLTVNGAIATGGNALTVTGNSNTTLAGAISQGGSLTKTGNGTLTVSANNSYGGNTTVSGGTLVVSHPHALGSGSLTINGIATTKLQSGLSTPVQLSSLTIAGGSALTAMFDVADNSLVVDNTTDYDLWTVDFAQHSDALSGNAASPSANASVQSVPEPGALVLAAIGVAGTSIVTMRRRRSE